MSHPDPVVGLDTCLAPASEERVRAAQAVAPSAEETAGLASLGRLLGDPTRIRIRDTPLETGAVRNRREGRTIHHRHDDVVTDRG
ncbi:MAG: hypothetical protein WD638_09795 [Nitriliruptoraceae bacterium]